MDNLLQTLEENTQYTVHEYVGHEKTVIIGVSGGPDSVALLDLMQNTAKELDLKIIAAHLNHGLRGKESDEDEIFVQNLAKKYGNICVTGKTDVAELQKTQKLSLEDAARQARYAFFYRIKEEYSADFILLGHNRDDNIETMLMNLIRGCGVKGLIGILMAQGDIVRPVLDFSKKELEEYCAIKKLPYRYDSTNSDTKFRRNYIRHVLIPAIEKINPNFRENFHNKSFYFEEIEELLSIAAMDFMKKYVKTDEKRIVFAVATFKRLMIAAQRTVIQKIYEIFHGSTKGLSFDQIEQILTVIYGNRSGTEKFLGNRLSMTIVYGKAIFEREKEEKEETLPEEKQHLPIPGKFTYPGGRIITRLKKSMPKSRSRKKIYIVAKDKNEPFFIRRYKPGDRIRPFGISGTKKIQDLFTDEKIPQNIRRKIPIITDQKDQIVAVGNLRVDRGFHPKILPGIIIEIEFHE